MQNDYKSQIIRLQNEVNRVFGKVVTSVADFEQLAEQVHLSPQSLRRFYGKIDKNKQLSATSLNLICAYIGMPDWESFCKGVAAPLIDTHRIINAFYEYGKERKKVAIHDLAESEKLVADYQLFIDKSIQRGYAENSGTDLDSIIPPTSRRQGARERKKQEVLRKIQLLVETYSGI